VNSINLKEWDMCKSSNKILHIKNFRDLDVSWDKMIILVNRALLNESDAYVNINNNYKEPKYLYQNDVSSVKEAMGYLQFISQMPNPIENVNEMINDIDSSLGLNIKRESVQFFCNFLSVSYISEIHSDPWDAVVFQTKGTTIWDIFAEDKETITESIELKQGDLILVPKGLVHRVSSNSSRATLNFPIPSFINNKR